MASFDPIDINTLEFWGKNLVRPECVLCTQNGSLYTSDWRGGIAHITAEGEQRLYLSKERSFELKPNGIALEEDGSFLIAHLGEEEGGVFRLNRQGNLRCMIDEIEGRSIPPTNYVLKDYKGRLWVTVSTNLKPRALGYKKDVSDGFIIVSDERGTRVAAENLGYTNEVQVDPTGKWLYVNETFGRRLSRFSISENNSLGKRETVTEFGEGVFPDGLTFDSEGGVWITSIVSNKVIRVDDYGKQQMVLEDSDSKFVETAENAFQNGELQRKHLDHVKSRFLKNISSMAFGGIDLNVCFLGCLLGDSIASFTAPIKGHPPVHWRYNF